MPPTLCPHGMNPLACPTCYHARNKEQQTRPKGTSGEPGGNGLPRAPVVSYAAAAANPQAQAILARKQAALAKLGGAQGAPAPVAPRPQVPPTKRARRAAAEESGDIDSMYSEEQLAELAAEFETRNSIIDSHERHPEAASHPGKPIAR